MKYCKWCPRKSDDCDGYDKIQDFYNCPLVDTFCDYKDVAEFEARVVRVLLRPINIALIGSPCIYGTRNLCTCDCPSPYLFCKDARLKWARLRAEEEIDNDSRT